VHCLDSLGVAAFVGVSDPQTKLDLAEHLLRPLDGEPELSRTLAAFFEADCCPSATAAQLEIHRNTLAYRLDRIARLVNLNPRQFDDAVQLRIALLVRSVQPA
jgi:carbohydrate diacid regulator